MELFKFAEIFEKEIRKRNIYSKLEIEVLKRKLAKEFKIRVPKNTELIELINDKKIKELLISKPIRSISGVNVLTVVAPAFYCPGNCIYCPSFPNIPKSYTPNEPAIQRALRNNYDPYLQTKDRLKQFELLGQLKKGAKIEVIILGGTFMALDSSFREWFIKRIFDALNGKESKSLEEAHLINESSDYRCVNLTVETRPDYCFERHVDEMLSYGTTRVEIGVQSIYDDVLEFVKRNHTVSDVIKATKIARNAGLKICYHIMPNLPKSDLERDLEMFKELFENPDFRPDYLKIYPLQLFKNTILFKLYEKGEFKLYSEEELVELLAKAKKFIPPYVRIQRLGRDIPLNDVDIAYPHTNLREYVRRKAAELGIFCKCIRCREVGLKLKDNIFPEKVELENFEIYLVNGKPILVKIEEKIFPTLIFEDAIKILPKIVVDEGATPYVCRGADVMRPGIIKIIGDFPQNSFVVVVEEKYQKPIALGLSLHSSQEIWMYERGKMVKNLHYVGDDVWNFLKNLKLYT